MAEDVLRPFKVATEAKKFLPREMPTLYSTTGEGNFFRSLERSKEVANPLWSGVLGNISKKSDGVPHARLCFNYDNPLVRRLAAVTDRNLLRSAIQMLYVQALLLGHHPLSSREMRLVNEGLLGLIDAGISAGEGNQ
jgi:molecular chaperone HtpG